MRFSSLAFPAVAANLAAALPAAAPQDIDLDMVLAAPDPTYSQAVGVTAQTVTYDTTAIAAQATEAVSSVSVEISDVLSSTAVVQRMAKRSACATQPAGATGAPSYSPDSASAFAAATGFATIASAAPTPAGYSNTFTNSNASNNAYGYMGFTTFDTYDTNACATACNNINGCMSFNMYFERDPSLDPGTGCSDPPSVTMIKCIFWGGPVSSTNANNYGQFRSNFQVAIAGSNGYVNKTLIVPPGYQQSAFYGDKALNAPHDAQAYDTFMGSTIFTQGAFNATLCSVYCDSQTAYNVKHPASDGTPPKVCKFFNTYILTSWHKDGSSTPQGQYCSLYTEAWNSSYATNGGQWRGSDNYLVSYSYGYQKLASTSDIDPSVGDSKGAAYQAKADILWSSLQRFCSTLLAYSVPVVTSTPLTTVTSLTTVTPLVTSTVLTTTTALIAHAKRSTALSTPAGLTKYKEPVLSSACSMVVTKPTATSTTTAAASTITAATSTVTAAAQTTLVTSVTTVEAPASTQTMFVNYNYDGSPQDPWYFFYSERPGTPSYYSTGNSITTLSTASEAAYCPNLNGDTVGRYLISCGKTHFGTLSSLETSTVQSAIYNSLGACMDLCNDVNDCVATAFDTTTRTCSLYSAIGGEIDAPGIDFAIARTTVAADNFPTVFDPSTSYLYATTDSDSSLTYAVGVQDDGGDSDMLPLTIAEPSTSGFIPLLCDMGTTADNAAPLSCHVTLTRGTFANFFIDNSDFENVLGTYYAYQTHLYVGSVPGVSGYNGASTGYTAVNLAGRLSL